MDTTRRAVLTGVAVAGAAAWAARVARGDEAPGAPGAPPEPPAAGKAAQPLKVLVLGGTAFLGPEIVGPAVARGHAVTLFNRGKTNPGLFPDLERLRGDRNGDVKALEGRAWDVVIDTSAYVPKHVRSVMEVLAEKVRHYVLVSTISVYPKLGENREPVDEETPVGTVEETPDVKVTGATYGPLKALCEQAAEKAMPGRVANVRPGLIVGPGDPTNRFTYWPVRIARGGDVLCPGDGSSEAQAIDVRDLGRWIVRVAEERTVGVYNAVGFKGTLSFQEFLAGAKCELNTEARLVWVPEATLEAQKVSAWHHLPMWIPASGSAHVSNARAVAKGLEFRPVTDTLADTLAWVRATKREVAWGTGREPGLSAEREAAVLAAHGAAGAPK
jgi:2'-hydroxyisoflavone reductase